MVGLMGLWRAVIDMKNFKGGNCWKQQLVGSGFIAADNHFNHRYPWLGCFCPGVELIWSQIKHLIGIPPLIYRQAASAGTPPAAVAVLLADHASAGEVPAAPLRDAPPEATPVFHGLFPDPALERKCGVQGAF